MGANGELSPSGSPSSSGGGMDGGDEWGRPDINGNTPADILARFQRHQVARPRISESLVNPQRKLSGMSISEEKSITGKSY
eukprot:2155004-Pyramimonas_sp.AAC.1